MIQAINRRTLWVAGSVLVAMFAVLAIGLRGKETAESAANYFGLVLSVGLFATLIVLVIGLIIRERAHGRQKKQFLPAVEQLAARYGLTGVQREILMQVTHQLADIYPGRGEYGRLFSIMDTLTTSGILTGVVAELHTRLKKEFGPDS